VELMMRRRNIRLEWIEDTLRDPASERLDPRDPTLKLAFRKIPEAGDKWLRVVYRMENNIEHVVITTFFDRNQEGKT
jgi:hypothetical protein